MASVLVYQTETPTSMWERVLPQLPKLNARTTAHPEMLRTQPWDAADVWVEAANRLPRFNPNRQDRHVRGQAVIMGLLAANGERKLLWIVEDRARKTIDVDALISYRNWGAAYRLVGNVGVLEYGLFKFILDPIARHILNAEDRLNMLRVGA